MSTDLLKCRDYQAECIEAIETHWESGVRRPASVLPTGAGKTVIFAHLAERYLKANPHKRVLTVSHTDELVLQAVDKVRRVAPHRAIGIVKADRNDITAQVISASRQTLLSAKRRGALRNVGLIIIDEAHHATRGNTYGKVLEHFGAFEPDGALVAGFTATLVRSDKAKLSDVWQEVAFSRDIAFMIRRGYLLDVTGRRVIVPDLNLRDVKVSGGDYQDGALGEALVESYAPEIVAKAYAEHAGDRKGLLFAPTVETAYLFADAFNEEGIKTEVVHGKLPREERRAVLRRLREGVTQVVSNCMVLTEGFDDPTVSCIVVARPTKSAGLYQQMVGRGLRPDLSLAAADRGHALVLDVVGISRQHNLRSLIDLSSRKDLPEDLDEDLTLLELEDWEEQEEQEEQEEEEKAGGAGPIGPEEYYRGPVEVEDFDPLARKSKHLWTRTEAGVYWMPAGADRYVFLCESLTGDPGTFDIVWCTKNSPWGNAWAREKAREQAKDGIYQAMTEHRELSFEMSLSWAEEVAIDLGGYGALTLSTKSARWRKGEASEAQVKMAQRMNIDTTGMNRGEVSEAIDKVAATRRIDDLIKRVRGAA